MADPRDDDSNQPLTSAGWQPGAPADPPNSPLPGPPGEPPPGPPGSQTFSLEDRPAAGLYLVAWLLSGGGIAVMSVGWFGRSGPLLLAGLLLLTLGLGLAAGYQLVNRRSRPAQAYRGPAPLLLFGLWFALVNLGAIVLAAFGLLAQPGEPMQPAQFLIALLVQTGAYLAVIWVFVLRSGALNWRELGWPGFVPRRLLADTAFSVGVMIPTTFIALIIGGMLAQLLDAQPPAVVPTPEDLPGLIAVGLAAAVLAPIGEELFFRGVALTAWLRDLGPRAALIRSSVFFALIHVANIEVAAGDDLLVPLRQAVVLLGVILPLGFVLGWLFIRRGLLAPIVGHIVYNGIVLALLVISTQLVGST